MYIAKKFEFYSRQGVSPRFKTLQIIKGRMQVRFHPLVPGVAVDIQIIFFVFHRQAVKIQFL